jgi:hypothetical protein
LVRALAAAKGEAPSTAQVADGALRSQLLAEVASQKWSYVHPEDVVVKDGVVHLWFSSDQAGGQKQAVRVAAQNIAGVKGIEEHIVSVPLIPGV